MLSIIINNINVIAFVSILWLLASIIVLFFIARYFYYKANTTKVLYDAKILSHVTHLMPWIYAQLSKSVEITLDAYKLQVRRNIIKRDITMDTYNKIINDIRTHFYGTIPKSLSTNLFKYVDAKQIEILLLANYRLQNESYFTIVPNNENTNV